MQYIPPEIMASSPPEIRVTGATGRRRPDPVCDGLWKPPRSRPAAHSPSAPAPPAADTHNTRLIYSHLMADGWARSSKLDRNVGRIMVVLVGRQTTSRAVRRPLEGGGRQDDAPRDPTQSRRHRNVELRPKFRGQTELGPRQKILHVESFWLRGWCTPSWLAPLQSILCPKTLAA